MTNQSGNSGLSVASILGGLLILLFVLVGGGCFAYPHYNVFTKELRGKAALREAEWNRQIIVQEAEAMRAAEVERAEGVAEANRIIGESLAGNEEYLRYLWIQSLGSGSSEVIYVPTEANLPLLEASRLSE